MKILLLEDSENDADLIERTLKRDGFDCICKRVETENDFKKHIKTFHPEVILSDHSLPQYNSQDAFKYFKTKKINIPFILVTGTVSEEFAVQCLKEGMDDYILKSHLARLPNAIRNAINQKKLERLKKQSDLVLKNHNRILVKTLGELNSFIYNISHNISAPLASMAGLVNLMKIEEQNADRNFTELIDLMEKSIKRLNLTINNIIKLSLNNRNNPLSELIDVKNIIQKGYRNLSDPDRAKKLKINTTVNTGIPFYSDKFRLEVIFSNIISNSIKYKDETKKESYLNITVQIGVDQVKMEFSDNGIGIKEAELPKVFEMFKRNTEKSNGAGLGLYIVKEIVERLNGKVNLSSIIGEGTTIKITLPNQTQM